MPFNKETAAVHGKKGGGNSWKDRKPGELRDKSFLIKITTAERDEVKEKAADMKLSNAELVVRAVRAYKGE